MNISISTTWKKIFVYSTLMMLMAIPLRAAGPVTHAILADRFISMFPQYDEQEITAFRLGTLFADVKYISNISREETHFPDVTIDDILSEPSPFIAGMKFHSLVDTLRDNFVAEGNYYDLFSGLNVAHMETYLKFLEDEIVYPTLDKGAWKACLKTIHPDEKKWGVSEETLKRWHYILDLAFSYRPSNLILFAYLKGNGLLDIPASEVSVWNDTFEIMAKSKGVKAYVNALFQMFASQVNQED